MARATGWVKINLFLSSYFPLWIILLVMELVRHRGVLFVSQAYVEPAAYLASNWIHLCVIGIFAALSSYPLRRVQNYMSETVADSNTEKITVQSKEDLTSEYLLYVITYIFPFMTASSFDELSAIALGGAMITIAVLYIRINLFHVNPTLLLLYSYRLYKIVDDKNNTYHLLSKQETILSNMKIRANSLNGILYVEKPFSPDTAVAS